MYALMSLLYVAPQPETRTPTLVYPEADVVDVLVSSEASPASPSNLTSMLSS